MDSLNVMAVFAQVVEARSFSGAARALGLSKSAVSKQIRRLEDRLRTRLINRTTRQISLTEAGAAFYQGCQRVLAEAEAAAQLVSHLGAAPRGWLRVNAPMSFGVRHVAPVLPGIMARYPELSIDLALNDRVVNLVDEGFDLGIRIRRLQDSSLIARRLAPSRRVHCAAPAYLARRGLPRRPEDLKSHDCLLYSYQSSADHWDFRGPQSRRRVGLEGRLRIDNGDALLTAALEGLGIALLPTFICGEALRAGQLVRILPDWRDAEEAAIYAVYPASRNLSPKVRVFVDCLIARFAGIPYWDHGLDALCASRPEGTPDADPDMAGRP